MFTCKWLFVGALICCFLFISSIEMIQITGIERPGGGGGGVGHSLIWAIWGRAAG